MRKVWLFVFLLAVPFLMYLLLLSLTPGRQTVVPLHAKENGAGSYLPVIIASVATATPTVTITPTATITPTVTVTATITATPTGESSPEPAMLINGSFEDCDYDEAAEKCNWPTLSPEVQPPYSGWEIYMVPKGQPLFGSEDLASGTSESRHLEWPHNIPPSEYIGMPDAIILDGKVTYKMFSFNDAFGTELTQTITLQPGDIWRLTVPINVHLHGETDPNAAESSVTVNGQPDQPWSHGFNMVDRRFCKHTVVFTVPADRQVHISIKVKSKYQNAKDFFIDDVRLTPASDPAPHEMMPECERNSILSGKRRIKTEDRYYDSWAARD